MTKTVALVCAACGACIIAINAVTPNEGPADLPPTPLRQPPSECSARQVPEVSTLLRAVADLIQDDHPATAFILAAVRVAIEEGREDDLAEKVKEWIDAPHKAHEGQDS
jgi:hypothetical protein